MIDFEKLAQRKIRNMIVAVCLASLLLTLFNFQIIPDSFFIFVISLMLLSAFYSFHSAPYYMLLQSQKISKKLYEKIQYRTEILKAINPSYNYNGETNPFLNCHFFIQELEIQNNVDSILKDSIVTDDVKSNLKQVQREISKLLYTYRATVRNCFLNQSMWGKYIDRKINPTYQFFNDEDIDFFKNYHNPILK